MISVTAEQMRRIDELATEKYRIKLEQMMELAGFHLAVLAKKVLRVSFDNKGVVVMAGKGNNGGGGLVAARHLSNWGADVKVVISQKIDLRDSVRGRFGTLESLGFAMFFYDSGLSVARILSESELILAS